MFALLLKIIRDLILVPFNLVVVVPYLLYNKHLTLLREDIQLQWLGALPFTVGLLLLFSAIVLIASNGKGSFAVWAKKENLTVTGVYAYVRNPIAIGIFLLLLGESLLFNSSWIFYYALIFLVVCHFYLVFVEEELLEKRFRVVFHHYRKRVPRWIPQSEPYKQPKFRSSILEKIKQGSGSSRSKKASKS